MNLPTYFSDPQVQNLQQIIEDIKRGGLLIPRFQRLFQWTDDQRLTLLQSVREGLPIGSILVWRTTEHKLDTFPEIAGTVVPTAFTEGPPWQYLLDGHQRLTTLFGALRSRRSDVFQAGAQQLSEPERNWNIYFDLREGSFAFETRSTPPFHWVPTHILLDSVALLKFQRDLIKGGAEDSLVDAVDQLALSIRNYKIPVVPISTNDLRNVTVAFQRVNSGGTRMSDADMVIALTFDPSHDLRRDLDIAAERLADVGWELLEAKYVFAVVRVRENLEIASPDAGTTSRAISKRPELIQEAAEDIVKAAQFLRQYCSIGGPSVVPYSYQSVMLSEAMRLNPNPSPAIIRELCRWFWSTSYAAYFLGAKDREVTQALEEIRRIVGGEIPIFANGRLNIEPLPKRYDYRAARCKALAARLANLQPRGLDGKRFDAIETLAIAGPNAFVQLVPRRFAKSERFSGPENRFIIPPEQAPRLHAHLRSVQLRGLDPEWCSSHAVTVDAAREWQTGNYEEFLRLRRDTIAEIEDRFLEELGIQKAGV